MNIQEHMQEVRVEAPPHRFGGHLGVWCLAQEHQCPVIFFSILFIFQSKTEKHSFPTSPPTAGASASLAYLCDDSPSLPLMLNITAEQLTPKHHRLSFFHV